MIARVLGAIIVLGCVLSGPVRGQAAQSRGTTWDEHRANLERTIQEIESGQMLWVPDGPRLLPVRRQDFASSLVLMQIAPVRAQVFAIHPDEYPDPATTSEVSRIAREAVVATEAFRRALRAELDRVNAFLNANSGMGSVAVDITNSERVQFHLRSTWRLTVAITDRSSEFRNQAEVLRQATQSTLAITSVACSPTAPPKVDCVLSGRLTWNGDPSQPIAAFRTGSLAEDLRRASFTHPSAANSGLVRFSVSADLAGGNLDFWASLDPATGTMQAGTISWAASGRSTNVGTWSAVRQVQ